MSDQRIVTNRDSLVDNFLSLNPNDEMLVIGHKTNSVRCSANNVAKRWNRRFRVNETSAGLLVRRIDVGVV